MVITTQPRTPADFNGMKMDEIKAWLLQHNVKLPASSRQSLFALKLMAVEKLSQLLWKKTSEATKQGSQRLRRRPKSLGDVTGRERSRSSVSTGPPVPLATPSTLNLTLDDDVMNGVRFEQNELFELERLPTDYLDEQKLTDPFLTGTSANWNQRPSSSHAHLDQLMNNVTKPSSPKPKITTRSRSPSPSRYRPTAASTSIASSMEDSRMISALFGDQSPQSFPTQRAPYQYGSSDDPERSFLSRWLACSTARGQSFF